VLAGEFTIVNKQLLTDLMELGLWSPEIKNQIILHRGSIQDIAEIPDDLKELYKTVWEIRQRTLIDMAAERGAFIDQSQSFNVFIAEPTFSKLTSMHFYAWKKGLKTGMYYLRTRPAADAIQFTVDQSMVQQTPKPVDQNQSVIADNSTPMKTPTRTPTRTPGGSIVSPLNKRVSPIRFNINNSTNPQQLNSSSTTPTNEEELAMYENMTCRREEGCLVCGS